MVETTSYSDVDIFKTIDMKCPVCGSKKLTYFIDSMGGDKYCRICGWKEVLYNLTKS